MAADPGPTGSSAIASTGVFSDRRKERSSIAALAGAERAEKFMVSYRIGSHRS
jgi:hypothetical protein